MKLYHLISTEEDRRTIIGLLKSVCNDKDDYTDRTEQVIAFLRRNNLNELADEIELFNSNFKKELK